MPAGLGGSSAQSMRDIGGLLVVRSGREVARFEAEVGGEPSDLVDEARELAALVALFWPVGGEGGEVPNARTAGDRLGANN